MPEKTKKIVFLMADDDDDDCLLTKEAFDEAKLSNALCFVHDGDELLRYLRREGKYASEEKYPQAHIILLDLNMPKMDGRAALEAIKNDEKLQDIPVIVLTTSRTHEDIFRSYNLGASGFITKPVTFDGLMDAIRAIGHYGLEVVELPKS